MSIAQLHELAAALDQHNETARSEGRLSPADFEPLLPNKPRGVPRVDDRRVLNGISRADVDTGGIDRATRSGRYPSRHKAAKLLA